MPTIWPAVSNCSYTVVDGRQEESYTGDIYTVDNKEGRVARQLLHNIMGEK